MAMPRGSGKTTICECACIWAALNGHREFVCLIGSDEGHAMDMLDSIKMELDGNELLLADYPEVVFPIQALDGIAIVLTLAHDVVGTGPRLQMLTGDSEANRRIEQSFMQWARSVHLAEKLRTMRMARATDGESFAILTNNPRLNTEIQLDLRLVEADQVTTPDLDRLLTIAVDGIVFDSAGNPIEYHILRNHPGDGFYSARSDYERIPADAVLHWFRADRPGQTRGIRSKHERESFRGITSRLVEIPSDHSARTFVSLPRVSPDGRASSRRRLCGIGMDWPENGTDPDKKH